MAPQKAQFTISCLNPSLATRTEAWSCCCQHHLCCSPCWDRVWEHGGYSADQGLQTKWCCRSARRAAGTCCQVVCSMLSGRVLLLDTLPSHRITMTLSNSRMSEMMTSSFYGMGPPLETSVSILLPEAMLVFQVPAVTVGHTDVHSPSSLWRTS